MLASSDILMATAIFNRPRVGILGGGATSKRAVVVAGREGGDAISVRCIATLSGTWAHRVLGGVAASQLLGATERRLETVASQPISNTSVRTVV
jgi:pyruvate dehydrogenase E2 component (dihydrolipoamide acetyltransferase)